MIYQQVEDPELEHKDQQLAQGRHKELDGTRISKLTEVVQRWSASGFKWTLLLFHGLDPRNIEDQMDPHSSWQPQAGRAGIQDMFYNKGSNKYGHQFVGLHP